MINELLDGDLEALVRNCNLVWLPAHQPVSAIGSRELSNGKKMTAKDWRANRLVDVLARKAAETGRAPPSVRSLIASGRSAAKHAAALLGVVTHAANNHRVTVRRPDGTMGVQTMRDAQQPAKRSKGERRRQGAPPAPAPLGVRGAQAALASLQAEALKRTPTPASRHSARKRRLEAEATQRAVTRIAESAASATQRPSAKVRLAEVHRRVRARLAIP